VSEKVMTQEGERTVVRTTQDRRDSGIKRGQCGVIGEERGGERRTGRGGKRGKEKTPVYHDLYKGHVKKNGGKKR